MEKTNHSKAPEVIDAQDFDPQKYEGRDVVFVKVPREEIGREVNFFGVRLRASIDHHPAIVGALGGGALGWELLTTRNTIAKMLMTDDSFAKQTFRGGAFKDIHERYGATFNRYHGRESGIVQMFTDPINRMRMQFKVGKEVKQRGVGVREAIGHWRIGHWLTVLTGAAAVGYGVFEMSEAKKKAADAQANEQPDPLLGEGSPKDWRGKVFGTLHQITK